MFEKLFGGRKSRKNGKKIANRRLEIESLESRTLMASDLIIVSPKSAKTTEEGGMATIKLHLKSAPTAPVTVKFHSDNLAEGVPDITEITFTGTEVHEIKVTGQPDGVKGKNPKYNLVFDPAESTDTVFAGFQTRTVKLTNKDLAATIKIDDKKLVTNELGGTDKFNVVLSQKPTAQVDVPLALPEGAFISVDKTVLHFDAQNWNVPQTVTVTGHDDGVAGKKSKTYKIDLLPAVSTDPKYNNLDVKKNVVSVKNVYGAIDAQFNGQYTGNFMGLIFGQYPMNSTLDATILNGKVTVTSLSATISNLPAEIGGSMTINTSGVGNVTAVGKNLFVSFKFATDGSLLANKEVKNIPLVLSGGVPTLKGKAAITFDGSIFGVGDVPVDVDWNIAKTSV